ncbi:MAG: lysozyme [Caulobacteraceae bacterium]|nr:lysozyme [Caulobacteraceae bacterium]
MTRPVPDLAVQAVLRFEGEVLRVYDDKRPNVILKPGDPVLGTLTAGTGHTGSDVVIGMTVTPELSAAWRRRDLETAARRLANVVNEPVILALTEHEYAALLDFVFNLGDGDPAKPRWDIWNVLNARRLDLVPDQMKRFDKIRDRKTGVSEEVPGLMHRRLAECALWTTPDIEAAAAIATSAPVPPPPSSVTREADTPQTLPPVKPLVQSKSFVASCASAAAGVAACTAPVVGQVSSGVKSVSDAIAPYADANDHIKQAQAALMMVMAGLAVATVVLVWLKNRNARIS